MTDSPNCPRCALIVIRRLQRTSQVHPNAPHGVIRRPVTVVIITVKEVSSRIVSVHTRYPSCTISSRPWLQTAGNTQWKHSQLSRRALFPIWQTTTGVANKHMGAKFPFRHVNRCTVLFLANRREHTCAELWISRTKSS